MGLILHPISIPSIAMASVNIYVGIYFLSLFFMQRKKHDHLSYLSFAVLCFCAGAYSITTSFLYSSNSLSEGMYWTYPQMVMAALFSIAMAIFTSIFTRQNRNKIIIGFVVALTIILSILVFADRSLLLTQNPTIKHIQIMNFQEIVYYETEPGILMQIELLTIVSLFCYLFIVYLKHYIRNRERTMILFIVSQFVFFGAALNDSLVSEYIYKFIYMSEYSYFLTILSMTIILVNRHALINVKLKDLNETLELKVVKRTEEIEKLNHELQHLADYDALTGVYNRRFFDKYFEIEIRRAINQIQHKAHINPLGENDMNFGLAIIDIDHFKHINDNYGHPVGDRILTEVIEIIKSNIFTRDVLCRYGGDEFALLMTKTSDCGIVQAAEKLRKEIESRRFEFDEDHKNEQVTISVGIVNFNETLHMEYNEILKAADDRLLKAKTLGRNMVVASPDETTEEYDKAV
jgi:diguanylate cyclase (GGDEF)-like protein